MTVTKPFDTEMHDEKWEGSNPFSYNRKVTEPLSDWMQYKVHLYFLQDISLGSVVGWGTVLRVGKSRVRIPTKTLNFFIDLMVLSALWSWDRLSLTEMSTRNFAWGGGRRRRRRRSKEWLARRSDLSAICQRTVYIQCVSLDVSKP
jgi:hypothetical protein